MKIGKTFLRSGRRSRGRLIGLALMAVGLVMLLLASLAQAEINEIGATNDPALLNRLSVLEKQRDGFLMPSIALLFLGLFAIFLLAERSTSSIVPEAQMISSARAMDGIVKGLALTGNSRYLPARHGLTMERLFVPASTRDFAPPVAPSDELRFSPGKDGSTPGMMVEPLGLSMLDKIEKELGASATGMTPEQVEGLLQMSKQGLGIVADFHLKERDGKLVMRVEYGSLLEACRGVRRDTPDICRQFQCAGCSCILTALSRGTGKIVSVDEVDSSQDRVLFTLSLSDW